MKTLLFCLPLALGVTAGGGQMLAQQMPIPYGLPITLDAAKRVAPVALAEARKNSWTMAVAVVDGGGDLVYFERMDNTQLGSVDMAIAKARSAARYKRTTRTFQDT